jgi:hypothetical protein
MYVWRNIEARSCNDCCNGRKISITQSQQVFAALGIQHAMGMGFIIICSLLRSTIFFPRYLNQDTIFGKKKLFNIKGVYWFSLQNFVIVLM